MTAIQVQDFRVSFIWFLPLPFLSTEAFANEATSSTDPTPVFPGSQVDYENIYQTILEPPAAEAELMLPWQAALTNFFWKYYLNAEPKSVSSRSAWKQFVPFRKRLPFKIDVDCYRFFLEAYYYPYGIGLIATAHCSGKFTLETMIQKAFQIRRRRIFKVELQDKDLGSITLSDIAQEAFEFLCSQAQQSPAPAHQLDTPYTVFTVVRGKGVNVDMAVTDDKDLLYTLEAMTNWEENYLYIDPTPWKEASLIIRRRSPRNHVLYASKKGRAIWFPVNFMHRGINILSFYHRNMVLATLQVEGLCKLVAEGAELINKSVSLTRIQREYLRNAVLTLGRLYGGGEQTYRTYSVRAQLEQNDMVQTVNFVRKYFNEKELSEKQGDMERIKGKDV